MLKKSAEFPSTKNSRGDSPPHPLPHQPRHRLVIWTSSDLVVHPTRSIFGYRPHYSTDTQAGEDNSNSGNNTTDEYHLVAHSPTHLFKSLYSRQRRIWRDSSL